MFYEFLEVLAFSKKSIWFLFTGLLGFIFIMLYGNHIVSNFQLTGPLAPMSDVIKETLQGKYDKVALSCLGSFILLAIRQYRKDKRRFYHSF